MTVSDSRARPAGQMPAVDVFGVSWPVYKLHALVAGCVVAALVALAGGPATLVAPLAAGTMLVVWWGERTALVRRWDDGRRERHFRH